MEKSLTLYELNLLVRDAIEMSLDEEYWVEAELSEMREVRGHCYMELVQKDAFGSTPVARASAKCWKTTWERLRPRFERTTGQTLHAGMKVLLRVTANFHEAFGFSWIMSDIDPTYTIGDMARKRMEIVAKLKEAGVFDLQKELSLPLFCQRIAVISSETAAGYGDFCNQLADNPYGFQFRTWLFPAIMQGEGIEKSIIEALNRINAVCDDFDVVVIIRGGGATSDMSGFDTLALAENVANFPLPIITGIGHERDESVLDMVSHIRVKTPTAAATFLISHLKEVLDVVEESQNRITRYAQQKLSTLSAQLTTLSEMIPRLFSVVKTRQEARLESLQSRMISEMQQKIVGHQSRLEGFDQRIPILLERKLLSERHRMEMMTEKVKSLDPALLLQRGYSITLKDGKAVRDAAMLKENDIIETRLSKGTIRSKVTK